MCFGWEWGGLFFHFNYWLQLLAGYKSNETHEPEQTDRESWLSSIDFFLHRPKFLRRRAREPFTSARHSLLFFSRSNYHICYCFISNWAPLCTYSNWKWWNRSCSFTSSKTCLCESKLIIATQILWNPKYHFIPHRWSVTRFTTELYAKQPTVHLSAHDAICFGLNRVQTCY